VPRRQTRGGRGAGAWVPPVDYRDELRLVWPQLPPQPLDSLPQSRAVAPIFRDKTRRPGEDASFGFWILLFVGLAGGFDPSECADGMIEGRCRWVRND
jgi:hypothetical protein